MNIKLDERPAYAQNDEYHNNHNELVTPTNDR